MSKPKLTEWFPSTIKPVHEGVYEVHSTICGAGFSLWREGSWLVQTPSTTSAERQQHRSFTQLRKWRGVSKK